MMMKYYSIILVTLHFISFPLLAQPDPYQFTRIDINQGLSNNQVNSIFKDKKGFMWFGTMSGLNRYDGYTFKVFRNDLRDSASISDNYIDGIFEGPEGNLWVHTRSGMNIYDPKTETFSRKPGDFLSRYAVPNVEMTAILRDQADNYWFISLRDGLFKYNSTGKKTVKLTIHAKDSATVSSNAVAAISEESSGDIWIMHKNGILEKMDGKTNRVIYRDYTLQKKYQAREQNYSLYLDTDNEPWVFVNGDASGVFYFNWQKKSFLHMHKDAGQVKLNEDMVRSVVQDNQGLIWIGTDHGGINLFNKKNFTISAILHNSEDEKSISQNSIYTLYKDNTGIIWAGTYKKGVNYYHENIIKFGLYKHQATNSFSVPYEDANRFVEDAKGNIWIGTNGGGLLYFDRSTGRFSRFSHNPANPNSLSSDIIVGLFLDHAQKLWIGTYFGGLDCFDGKQFIHYKHDPNNPESLADNRIWDIFEDSQKNLWIGTLGGGLDLLEREQNIFHHYKTGDSNSVHSNYISSIIEDKQGTLWIATAYGIDKLDKKTHQFVHYVNNNNNPKGLSNNNTNIIFEDSRGMIWIGTNEGLNLFDKNTGTFTAFRKEDGLPDNTIHGILEDNHKSLWLSTSNGLSNVQISQQPGKNNYSYLFKNYDEADGLQGKAFNNQAAYKTSKGELIFGGSNGINIFQPDAIKTNTNIPVIVFTDFQGFNKSVRVNENINGRIVLSQSFSQTQEITLPYDINVFTIEFAALNYFHPEKNKYMYRLEGFNSGWLTTDGNMRKATYTNLDPGSYIFRVKASNNDGVWNEEGIKLKITILPPFWKTPLAFALYVLLILGALVLSRRLILERAKLNFQMEQERKEAQRMHELDMMKIKFFTNVSHEFRTPLTLILTPLDKLVKNAGNPDQKRHFLLIYRNARRLLNLVNQLLDFRKLEEQEIRLNPVQGDIIKFIKDISYSFSDLSEKKHIQFSFHTTVGELETYFDADKLEKILFNLLSNAFKFTPEEGRVAVEIQLRIVEDVLENSNEYIEIKILDTGIGIPAEKHDKIFERFFQHEIPGTMVNQGSGIGLSIAREFVKLHGGTISVESEPDKGSSFIVLLPLRKEIDPVATQVVVPEEVKPVLAVEKEAYIAQSGQKNGIKKPVVLLIEDNADFRFYLRDNLKAKFNIAEASNGKEGWQQVLALVPDLIVSDVMMPEMDGIELCKKIKTDHRTSHIPVILLTARAAEEQQLQGLETGANDYVTKPFNFELLLSRIKNLITQRELIRKTFQKQMEINPSEVNIPSLDEKLIQKTLALVEKNMANAEFSVEELSRELGMSRVYLYKKLLALTGKTPIEFIRTVRLKRAAQLLEKSQLTVSEIAYQVGFNNPKYFTKYFKMEFDTIPSLYVAEKNKEKA